MIRAWFDNGNFWGTDEGCGCCSNGTNPISVADVKEYIQEREGELTLLKNKLKELGL